MAVQQASNSTNPSYDTLAKVLREENGATLARERYPQWCDSVSNPISNNRFYFPHACSEGDLQVARALLEMGADATTQNGCGRNALMLACYRDNDGERVKMVTWLLQCVTEIRTNINDEDKWGDTALHHAARNGGVEIVRLLLRFGANCTKRNREGHTVEELARVCGKEESAALIVTFAQIIKIGEWRPWKASEFPLGFRRALRCLVVISKSGTNPSPIE